MDLNDATKEISEKGKDTKNLFINFARIMGQIMSCIFCLICIASIFTTSFGPFIVPCVFSGIISWMTTLLQDKVEKKVEKKVEFELETEEENEVKLE